MLILLKFRPHKPHFMVSWCCRISQPWHKPSWRNGARLGARAALLIRYSSVPVRGVWWIHRIRLEGERKAGDLRRGLATSQQLYCSGPGPSVGVTSCITGSVLTPWCFTSRVLVLQGGSAPPCIAADALARGQIQPGQPPWLCPHTLQRKQFARGMFPACSAPAAAEAKPSAHNAPQEKPREEI